MGNIRNLKSNHELLSLKVRTDARMTNVNLGNRMRVKQN